jgi:hypothetical protein
LSPRRIAPANRNHAAPRIAPEIQSVKWPFMEKFQILSSTDASVLMEDSRSSSSTGASFYFDNCRVGAIVKRDHPAQASALSVLMRQHELGRISAVASTEVLGEIQALPERYQGPHLQVWEQLLRLPASRFTWIDETSTSTSAVLDPDYATLCTILPDEMDRRHMFHAVKNGVKFFATVDQRSILNHASEVEAAFSIRCGKPTDVAAWLGVSVSTSTGELNKV